MSRHAAARRARLAIALAGLVVALGSGCTPEAWLPVDEDRERNYQRARDAERLGDYQAAAEYYERAAEKNPRSPAVQLGYAQLCDGPLRRPAEAVYHYQQYLRLRPDDPRAQDIRRRITNATERLATTVPLVIRSETIARDLEAMRRENASLWARVTNLTATVAYWSNAWHQASTGGGNAAAPPSAASTPPSRSTPRNAEVPTRRPTRTAEATPRPATRSPEPPARSVAASATKSTLENRPKLGPNPRSRASVGGPAPSTSSAVPRSGTQMARSHRVGRGETAAAVARRYGISLDALQRANRGVDLYRLPPGTLLRIPER